MNDYASLISNPTLDKIDWAMSDTSVRGNDELEGSLASISETFSNEVLEAAVVDETLSRRADGRRNAQNVQTVTRDLTRNEPKDQFETLLAEWNGCVTHVEGRNFYAVLNGVFGEGVEGEEEDAVIPVEEVSDDDRDLLQPGGFFRLCVFRVVTVEGLKSRVTQTVFRRLPVYRQADLDLASQTADVLLSGIPME